MEANELLVFVSLDMMEFNFMNTISVYQVISIESCDLMYIESDALSGLYSMTSLNLAYNDLQTLPRLVFSNLNLLQTLGE